MADGCHEVPGAVVRFFGMFFIGIGKRGGRLRRTSRCIFLFPGRLRCSFDVHISRIAASDDSIMLIRGRLKIIA